MCINAYLVIAKHMRNNGLVYMCNLSNLRLVFADGHTASNAPDLFRPPKLSGAGPG